MSNFDMDAPTATITMTLDCADTEGQAGFWKAALGYEEIARVDNFIVLGPAPGVFKLALQGVPEAKAGKNRMHLDMWVPDIESETARLEALGATRRQEKPLDEHGFLWYQLADPEGNEFCVGRA